MVFFSLYILVVPLFSSIVFYEVLVLGFNQTHVHEKIFYQVEYNFGFIIIIDLIIINKILMPIIVSLLME